MMLLGAGNISAADKWVKTSPASLQTGDIVVIVDQTSEKAMSNDGGTSSAPTAVTVDFNSDKSELDESYKAIAATIQWTVNVSDEGLSFYADDDNFLYCTNNNNGVRVGDSNDNHFFEIKNHSNGVGFLYNKGTSRYLGVYNNQDWRCYTSVNTNINTCVTAFYKKETTSGATDPLVTISGQTVNVGKTLTINYPENLPISFISDDTSIATVDNDGVVTGVEEGETTITASWEAVANTYNAGSKEFTVNVTPAISSTEYEKVTSTNQLVAGNKYILVAENSNVAMGAVNASNAKIRDGVEVTIANEKIEITDEAVAVLTLGGSAGAWTFLTSDNNKYLALTGNSNEVHASDDATLVTSKWIITDDFQLETTAQADTRYLRYNSGSPRFACYKSGQATAILYVKAGGEVSDKAEADLSFGETTAFEVNLGEEFTAPTLSNPNQLEVVYTSSNTDVATVDETTGAVTIVGAGQTTITASFAGNDEYNEGSASYTLTVVDPNAPGTENNPYTVAQAIEYINTLGSSTSPNEVYVSGIISQVDSYNSNYKSITYWISDDGTTSNQMEVYGGKGVNDADFASVDDLQVGDIVTVKGFVKTYSGTPEFDKNNQLVSHSRPTNTDPTITLDPSTINVDAEEHNGTIAISLENLTVEDKAEFGVQYWNGNEPVEEIDWITVEIAEQDPQVGEGFVVSYTVAANDGPTRTAAFKVYVEGDEDDVWSDLVTITQAAAPGIVDNYELFTGDLVEGDYLIVYDGKAMNTTVTNDRLQYTEVTPTDDVITTDNAAIVWHIAPSGEYWTIYNADADAYAASTGAKNKAQMLADGTDDKALWTVSGTETYEFVNKQNAANSVNANLRNNGTYGFACYATGTGGALSLYKKVEATPEYVTVSISSDGLATFCSENALDFTGIEEVYAYKVSVNEKQISYTRVYQVPAETGVVLRSLSGDAISVEVPVIESADEIADNALVAVLEAIESLPTDGDGCTNYILNNLPSKGVGFYKANNQPVGAGKAYLQVEGTLSKDFIGFADGVATGIETIDNGWTVDNEIYDLQGRKVMNPTKGIFIQNGRKVVIK